MPCSGVRIYNFEHVNFGWNATVQFSHGMLLKLSWYVCTENKMIAFGITCLVCLFTMCLNTKTLQDELTKEIKLSYFRE